VYVVVVYQRFSGTYCFHHQGDDLPDTRRYNPEDSYLVLRDSVDLWQWLYHPGIVYFGRRFSHT
jgi:hypothetical protein